MSTPPPRCAALFCAILLLSACAGTEGPSRDEHTTFDLAPDSGSDADRLLAVGDFEAAARLYQDALIDDPGSSVLLEKLATARRSAAQLRASQALEAASRGDSVNARRHLAAAEEYAPTAPIVRRTRAQLDDVLRAAFRATELVAQAEDLMDRDPEGSQDLLAEARRLDPKSPRIVRLLQEATLRAEAARASVRAERYWTEGDRERAVRELETAKFEGRTVSHANSVRALMEGDLMRETLDGELDTLRSARAISIDASLSSAAVRTIRDRLVAKLSGDAGRLIEADRPAVAALLETECLRLGVPVATPALDAVTARAQIYVAVAAFEDGTGGDVDGLRLARAVAARLVADARGGGAALGVIEPGPDQERLLAAHPRALRLTGQAIDARVSEGPRNAITRRIDVRVNSRLEPNPEAMRAEAEVNEVDARLSAVRELVADAETELARLEAAPFVRGSGGVRVGQGRVDLELSIRRAEARRDNLQRKASALSNERAAAQERLLAIPQQRDVPIYGEQTIEVLEFRKVAKVTAKLRMVAGDDVLLDSTVTGTAVHDEVVAPAVPGADLAEDPDDTPDDAAMAREAAAHFAVVAAGSIRTAAERAARRFLLDARAAERAGNPAAAAEGYALYLLSTAEVASPHRADAARALYDLAGVRVPLRTGAEGELR